MSEKELFEIALKYIEKNYSTDQLRYGDDLYDAKPNEKRKCVEYFISIKDNGLKWAYKHLNKL